MGNENTTKSYLDPPQLKGVKNSDGTYTLSGADLQAQRDFNYYVAKMLQGGLNLANLNEATNETFTGMVKFVDLSDPTKSTVIDGSHITTGTISADRVSGGILEGVTIISTNPEILDQFVLIDSGAVMLGQNAYGGTFEYDGANVYLRSGFSALKLVSGTNLSIDSSGTTYIGTSSTASGNVDIGKSTGIVNIDGTAYYNGVPLGAAVFT